MADYYEEYNKRHVETVEATEDLPRWRREREKKERTDRIVCRFSMLFFVLLFIYSVYFADGGHILYLMEHGFHETSFFMLRDMFFALLHFFI